ncbi:hypothetical protein [Thomasclavelia spiroformis]|uniref:hypothetical protein n=1 Tax=Thomasclavelia spiroformis TaxID=29348 RepID=UPI003996787B
MNIDKEIEKIVEYQNSLLPLQERNSQQNIESIISEIKQSYKNQDFNFSKFTDILIKREGKKRHIKTYPTFSCEEILCIYLKRTLDKKLHIKYPNRNEYIHSLFDVINALRNMNDFSIFRFDFEDYFNTVSSEYVFKKYIIKSSLERYQISLFDNFASKTKYAYAGLNTSNIICEIIAKHFDEILTLKLKNQGLIFYRRYIDDGILIFNKRVGSDFCLSIINDAIKEVFFDKSINVKYGCKTRLNSSKTKYLSAYDLAKSNSTDDFDFLGYLFCLSPKINIKNNKIQTNFKYGITQKKIIKYSNRIDKIVEDYKIDKDIELLRHRLKAFTFRTVYQIPKYKTMIWKTKGFISNYQELRYRTDMLTTDTKDFLENYITNSFKKNGLNLPYFLKIKNTDESIYNLYNNLKKYRTYLFVEKIGINKETLDKMCKQIGILDTSKDYDGLVRDYLIKVKVGH